MKDLLVMQRKLQTVIEMHKGTSVLNKITVDEKQSASIEMLLTIMVEAAEALEWLNWKSWKTYQPLTQDKIYEFKLELIDMQHFLNNLYIVWDMDEEEVKEIYYKKHLENIRRQENGY